MQSTNKETSKPIRRLGDPPSRGSLDFLWFWPLDAGETCLFVFVDVGSPRFCVSHFGRAVISLGPINGGLGALWLLAGSAISVCGAALSLPAAWASHVLRPKLLPARPTASTLGLCVHMTVSGPSFLRDPRVYHLSWNNTCEMTLLCLIG